MKKIYLLLFLLIVFSCNNAETQQMKARGIALEKLRDSLLVKERELDLKAQELEKREQMLDTTNNNVPEGIINPNLTGKWQVRMTCVETNCTGSAIGDVRNEQWNLSYRNDLFIVEGLTNGAVNTLYTGLYNGNELQLNADNTATGTAISIILTPAEGGTMVGRREVTQAGGCKIFYRLNLSKL
jgi:hypothetical protein